MFIPIVFGVSDKRHPLAHGVRHRCRVCAMETPHHLVEVRRQLALFFIPVWRWNKRQVLVCDVCGDVESVPPGEADALLASE